MQVRDLKSSKVFEEVLEIGFFSLKICFFSFHLFLTSLSAQKLIGEGEKKYLFFFNIFFALQFYSISNNLTMSIKKPWKY